MFEKLNVERKSRIIIGILALLALLIFLMTTFGSSAGVMVITASIGVFVSLLIFTETGIARYISQSKYKRLTLGDIVVFLGTIAGASLFIFSISIIPQIGEVMPEAVRTFTTNFARIIAGISSIIVLFFILTPKFE